MVTNKQLTNAQKYKKDEFYTQLTDIENELVHYGDHFKNKTMLCNCDDPRTSNFFQYFLNNFEKLGIKKLITTCYKTQQMNLFSTNKPEQAIWLEYTGDKNDGKIPTAEEIGIKYLKGDGDFRRQECINILKQADIIVTNPPFSLFREYLARLIKYEKKFLIIGNMNAITNKEIFPLIKNNKIWLGYNSTNGMSFKIPNNKPMKHMGFACWFTNLDFQKRHENITLTKKYNEIDYPKYDHYDAINVDKATNIPYDYDGVMGVPISFLDKYNPDQFEILGTSRYHDGSNTSDDINVINGKLLYMRLLIRAKNIPLTRNS